MSVITEKINHILSQKNLSRYKVSKLLDYKESTLNRIINGKQTISDELIEKLLPILEVSKEEFIAWIIADKYSKEAVRNALNALGMKLDNKPVLTKNIDIILAEKNLSRTELSKLIKYDQSGLNKMITGQISMSKAVILKLVPVLEVNEDTITGWILADEYSLAILIKSIEVS